MVTGSVGEVYGSPDERYMAGDEWRIEGDAGNKKGVGGTSGRDQKWEVSDGCDEFVREGGGGNIAL